MRPLIDQYNLSVERVAKWALASYFVAMGSAKTVFEDTP